MKTYTLERTGQRHLRFEGEQLSKRGAPGDKESRWHEVEVYRTESGLYVVAISWRTKWKGERNYDMAVAVSSLVEVDRVLQCYDPLAHEFGFPPGKQFEAKQRRLVASVRRQYEETVTQVAADVLPPEEVA